jgi:hypothetical protein
MSQISRKGVEKQLWKLREASRGSIKKSFGRFKSNEVECPAFAFLHAFHAGFD